ncbi:MAG: cell division protein ZapA [Moritella sp.]|uniref:cell division protein ZapA n=1 Tax=Moritella sp. TaxID=78556 RepID=UPI001D810375|nr:cell division protein ZapA [Moritella sp.]MBL1417040.1 cell division protein ZapA [Moritella sp.]NQZ49390.1 cell division protein ZapA [Moritella sp.]
MSTTAVDISILGRHFKVGSPSEEVDELHQTAAVLNNKLEEIRAKTNIKNLEQLAVMAALNFCHELRQERHKTTEYTNTVDDRIQLLQDTIERALINNKTDKEPSTV